MSNETNVLAKFSSVLKSKKNRALLEGALTHGLDMSRFIKCAWIQAQTNEDINELARTNPASVFRAMLQCAQMGLYPDGINGDAYLVKFKNTCVAIRGYKGQMKLFAASSNAAPLPFVVDVIREKDDWDLELGGKPSFYHKPAKKDRGAITHYYAVARFVDGSTMPKVMEVEEVEKYKAYSKTKTQPFWDSPHENTRTWMRLKTVVRQLIKGLPTADNVRADLAREEALETGDIDPSEYLRENAEIHIEGGEIKKTQGKPTSDQAKNDITFTNKQVAALKEEFAKFGVDLPMIEQKLGKKASSFTTPDRHQLIGLHNALMGGAAKEDVFGSIVRKPESEPEPESAGEVVQISGEAVDGDEPQDEPQEEGLDPFTSAMFVDE